jgi:hypothetical protein
MDRGEAYHFRGKLWGMKINPKFQSSAWLNEIVAYVVPWRFIE